MGGIRLDLDRKDADPELLADHDRMRKKAGPPCTRILCAWATVDAHACPAGGASTMPKPEGRPASSISHMATEPPSTAATRCMNSWRIPRYRRSACAALARRSLPSVLQRIAPVLGAK